MGPVLETQQKAHKKNKWFCFGIYCDDPNCFLVILKMGWETPYLMLLGPFNVVGPTPVVENPTADFISGAITISKKQPEVGRTNKKCGRKVKRKVRPVDQVMDIFRNSCRRGSLKRHNPKAMFRSAIAATSLYVSTNGIRNRNRILLNEAQAVQALDKILGTRPEGDEEEVVSKFVPMEDINEVCSRNKFLDEAEAIWNFEKTLGVSYNGNEKEVIKKYALDGGRG